jgi:hypothetical protein
MTLVEHVGRKFGKDEVEYFRSLIEEEESKMWGYFVSCEKPIRWKN